MGSMKDRNGMDLTAAVDIKKRWQEYTEELYKKNLPCSLPTRLAKKNEEILTILGITMDTAIEKQHC